MTLMQNPNIMLKKGFLLLVTGIVLLAVGCEDSNDDDAAKEVPQEPAKTIDRHNAAVVSYGQHVYENATIVCDTTSYYNGAGALVKQVYHADTLPTLDYTRDTLNTGRTYEDEDGDSHDVDTVITHHRSYQFFITVR